MQLHREAAEKVLSLVALYEEHAAASLWNVAEGAWYSGEWERAERIAGMALEVARSRKEGEPERGASTLLVKVAMRERAPLEAEAPPGSRIEQLTRSCFAKLQRWKAPGPAKARGRLERGGSEADPALVS